MKHRRRVFFTGLVILLAAGAVVAGQHLLVPDPEPSREVELDLQRLEEELQAELEWGPERDEQEEERRKGELYPEPDSEDGDETGDVTEEAVTVPEGRAVEDIPDPEGDLTLASPLPDYEVETGFGWRRHPVYDDWRLHEGYEYRAESGTPVRAAAPGRVIDTGFDRHFGETVLIEHDGNLDTFYGHLDEVMVDTGDYVREDQVIGSVGTTGVTGEPQLYFEVRLDGQRVNPEDFLGAK